MESRKGIVECMISKMEEGEIAVRDLWRTFSRPYNPESGSTYSGGNWMRLAFAAMEKNYKDSRWMTYKQAKNAGYQVKKGEKSTLLERWIYEKEVKEKEQAGNIIKKTMKLDHPICKYFLVFNAEQLEGIEPLPEIEPMKHDEMLETAENFIKSSECEIEEIMQNRSYYSPSKDKIVLPPRDFFVDQEAFLSVVLHEMAHSTGHETRLNRPLMNFFGTKDYAREELNAEMASAFIQSDLGIHLNGQLLDDHARYLQSWIQILKNDPNELFRAANQADKISKYLTENYKQMLIKEKQKNKKMTADSSEPEVTILWSESRELTEGQKLSFSEANELFGQLDREYPSEQGYDKTKFQIDYMFHGEMAQYEGRQDFGDGDGTLIQHMQSYYEFCLQDEEWKNYVINSKGEEAWEEEKRIIENFLDETIPYLKLHCNLSKLEQAAKGHLQYDETLTTEEKAYYEALLIHVNKGRIMLNQGEYQLPEAPRLIDFDKTLQDYKKNVQKEIAEEALDAGMTEEEYAESNYEIKQEKSGDFQVHYYSINETDAKRANEANSFSDYQSGNATEEYRRYVNEAVKVAQNQKKQVDVMYHSKIDQLTDFYARKLAENMNMQFVIDASVPSIMISGGGNFSARKKEKQNAARDKNFQEWEEIQGIIEKIKSTGRGGISADDPNAVMKLQKQLEKLQEEQELMKAVNAYYRKHKTLDDCPNLKADQIQKLKYEMEQDWHVEKKTYASYMLSNNNANIRRLKQRIESLNCHYNTNYPGWKFYGGEVIANKEANRMQVFFDDKPSESIRTELKRNGFRWSPKEKAWQRQLNQNAYFAADRISGIWPGTGEKPSRLYQVRAEEKTDIKESGTELSDDMERQRKKAFIFDEALEYGMTPQEFEQRIRGQPPTKSKEHDVQQLVKDVSSMLPGDSKRTKKKKKQRCR